MPGLATMDSLDTPKTGRSRFSKALPAPPPLETFSSSLDLDRTFPPRTTSTTLPNALPTPPPKTSLPAPPPRLDSPLPRQPELPPKTPPARPPMAIPRRPVALPSSPAPPPKTPKDSPRPPVVTTSAEPPAAPTPLVTSSLSLPSSSAPPAASPPSPANSILSLLSAYSRSSSESGPTRPSEGTASTKNSSVISSDSPAADAEKVTSPYTLPPLAFGNPSGSESMADVEKPPPPPVKDGGKSLPSVPPKDVSQTSKPAPSASVAAASPQAEATNAQGQSPEELELWRRRSLKADKRIEVSELKLRTSHGSTAAHQLPVPPPKKEQTVQESQQRHQQPPPPQQQHQQQRQEQQQYLQAGTDSLFNRQQEQLSAPLSADPNSKRQPPRSPAGGLPGRNIRPSPTPETQTQTETTTMGHSLAKVEAKMKLRRNADGEQPADAAAVAKPLPADDDTRRRQEQQQKPLPSGSPDKAKSAAELSTSIRRLPTPEYEQYDVKSPIVEQIVSPASPVSPASSPDLVPHQPQARKPLPSTFAVGVGEGPVVPQKHAQQPPLGINVQSANGGGSKMGGNFSSFPRSPEHRLLKSQASNAAVNESAAAPPGSLVGPPAGSVDPAEAAARRPSGGLGLPPTAQPHSQSLLSPVENASIAVSPKDQFPARTSSRNQELPSSALSRHTPDQVQPSDTLSVSAPNPEVDLAAEAGPSTIRAPPYTSYQQAQPPQPQPQPLRHRSSDGTSFKELVQTDEFDPDAARFPSMGPPPSAGTIFRMRGLRQSHWGCVHKHRYMAPTPNSNYPLACQTCAREDAEDRFRCRFCWLRVCAPCRDFLQQHKGNLGALMAHVQGGGAPLSAANRVPGSPVVISPVSDRAP